MINIPKLQELLWLLSDNYEAEKLTRQLYQEQETNEARKVINHDK